MYFLLSLLSSIVSNGLSSLPIMLSNGLPIKSSGTVTLGSLNGLSNDVIYGSSLPNI